MERRPRTPTTRFAIDSHPRLGGDFARAGHVPAQTLPIADATLALASNRLGPNAPSFCQRSRIGRARWRRSNRASRTGENPAHATVRAGLFAWSVWLGRSGLVGLANLCAPAMQALAGLVLQNLGPL